MTTTVLAADVGGTKTVLAFYDLTEEGFLCLQRQHRYASRAWPCFDQMLTDFLQREGPGGRSTRLASACFAVAGPVQQGQVHLTNLGWFMDQQKLARSLGTSAVEVINDIAVLVYGLPRLQPAMAVELQAGEPQPGGTVAVLGLGTGAGMAMGIATPTGLCSCPSEGGHQEFSPCNTREWQLRQWLLADLGLERLSVERVVSGTGLGHIGRWLLSTHPGPHPLKARLTHTTADLPARVAAAAAQGDALCQDALALWTEACGTAAANLFLTSLCTGGLWLAGGVTVKQLPQLRSPRFLQRLQRVGRFQPLAAKVPVHALIAPEAGLFAAAQRACQLAHSLAGTPSTSARQGCGPWGNMDSDS
ncbi:MAG: glucokinase [Synechococcus sp. SB0669_bin_8]|nr:glucokinase [Synechococcus sp. SB0669_bin_8]